MYPRDTQLTLRIPRWIRAAIDAEAAAEQRTASDVVNRLLEEIYADQAPKERRRR